MNHVYNSSFRFTTQTAMTKEDYRKAKHIINHIIQNPESVQFREPVNWQALALLDYPILIKNPMDLGTVLQKLNKQIYLNVQQFLDDTQMIWDNCKNYNSKGSWIYTLADKLQKNCKKMLKNYFPTIPMVTIKKQLKLPSNSDFLPSSLNNQNKNLQSQPLKTSKPKTSQKPNPKQQKYIQKIDKLPYQDQQTISLDEKLMLADKFKTLPAIINAKIVDYIKCTCPTAFKEIDDKIQILIHNMDVITFRQLIEKIEDIQINCLKQGNKKIKQQ